MIWMAFRQANQPSQYRNLRLPIQVMPGHSGLHLDILFELAKCRKELDQRASAVCHRFHQRLCPIGGRLWRGPGRNAPTVVDGGRAGGGPSGGAVRYLS